MSGRDDRSLEEVGKESDFPAGEMRLVKVGQLEIGVYNVHGELYAVRNYCPHRGAPICRGTVGGTMLPSRCGELIYGLEGKVLKCPWHRWEFNLTTGETVLGVDRRRLVRYPVSRIGDRVQVTVPRRLAHPDSV